MKRAIALLMLAAALTASAQTGLYKRYAPRPGLQAYCVERYPLSCGDSICVTLLQTDDSTVYRTLLKELHKLPYAPRGIAKVEGEMSSTLPEGMTQQFADSLARQWRERKHLVIFNADGLSGDKGYYAIYCPSDRMVVLAFLITNDAEALKVAGHMMSKEF